MTTLFKICSKFNNFNYPDEAPHHFRCVGETCVRNDIIKSLGWLDLIGFESRIKSESECDWVGLALLILYSNLKMKVTNPGKVTNPEASKGVFIQTDNKPLAMNVELWNEPSLLSCCCGAVAVELWFWSCGCGAVAVELWMQW